MRRTRLEYLALDAAGAALGAFTLDDAGGSTRAAP